MLQDQQYQLTAQAEVALTQYIQKKRKFHYSLMLEV
jgi:hypothetical protein